MNTPRRLAATGLAVGLIGGGAAGMILGSSGISGAVPGQDSTDEPFEAPETQSRQSPEEHLGEVLAPLVSEGTITAEQSEAVVAAISEAAPERGGRGHGHRAHHGLGVGEVAEDLGLDGEAFREAIRSGSTPAEAAEAQGVSSEDLVDALVASATERIESRVADGDMTAEEAEEKLAELTERITESVENGPSRRN